MIHKAKVIFNKLQEWFENKENEIKSEFNLVKIGEHSYQYKINRVVDTYDKQTMYFMFEFRYCDTGEEITRFTINSDGGIALCDYEREETLADIEIFINHFIAAYGGSHMFEKPITVQELKPFPENCNPFHHDTYNMGCDISGGWMAMYSGHFGNDRDGKPRPEPTSIILVNVRTGRRFELDLYEANKPLIKKES